eukprot:Gb_16586 [translate_table: standard]
MLHAHIIQRPLNPDIFLGNTLVLMYAECGTLGDALRVLEQLPKRNVVSWTAMIAAYSRHNPDHVTFVGVLSACCHAGLLDEGWQYFNIMSRDYNITPTVKHYCCMVDLLGRAGHLDEAQRFINKMPIKPDAAVWVSLLGACKIHTNIELGEHAAECLFELNPKNAANYVLLSNVYAAASRWNDIENVRKLMKDVGVKKKPGCSWIEVNNKVYAFLVETNHIDKHKIYSKLDRLNGQQEAGYMPNTRFVLHDVEEEQT